MNRREEKHILHFNAVVVFTHPSLFEDDSIPHLSIATILFVHPSISHEAQNDGILTPNYLLGTIKGESDLKIDIFRKWNGGRNSKIF